MVIKDNSEKKERIENIVIYITFNGVPLFTIPYNRDDDSYILMSSFLHTIDIVAKETRKTIGRSADFYGFDLINNFQVEVIEIISEDMESENKIRLFIQTPYGKTPINRGPIVALIGATQEIYKKIKNEEINLIYKSDTTEYFIEKLEDRGYTPDRIMSELKHLTLSQANSSKFMPISLLSIEKDEKNETRYKLEEIGNYNEGNYKKNPIKTDAGKLTFDSSLIIALAEVLKSYQSATNIKTESIMLRFRDYSLFFYYKKDELPVISVFIEGKGNIEEINRYHNDLRKLKLEIVE
jgi:hypothetical protein